MVIRYPVECLTCSFNYTLRISVGHREFQEHSFQCRECGEEIRVGMRVDYENIVAEPVCIHNCRPSADEGLVLNLYPEHPISQDEVHQDSLLPGLLASLRIFKKSFHHFNEDIPFVPSGHSRDLLLSDPPLSWRLIRKSWQLSERGKPELAASCLQELRSKSPTAAGVRCNIYDILHAFIISFIGRKFELVLRAGNVARLCVKQYESQYRDFLEYFFQELWISHQKAYINAISEYFLSFDQLRIPTMTPR